MCPDPIAASLFRSLFASVAEEMGIALERTAYSPNIKERRDYSCALFDPRGQLIAQAAHIPVHLGAFPLLMAAVVPRFDWRPGDVVIANDPYVGGTHLPDISLISPVFAPTGDGERVDVWKCGSVEEQTAPTPARSTLAHPASARPHVHTSIRPYVHTSALRRLAGFVASRAHHADVGGAFPGSLAATTELYQEGVIIPPLRLVEGGRLNEELLALICRNVRTGAERRGDFAAQLAANQTGVDRLAEILARYGLEEAHARTGEALAMGERAMRSLLDEIPDGEYAFDDCLDDDGHGSGPLPVRLRLTVQGDQACFDFAGSAPQCRGSVNATLAVTHAAVYYGLLCLLDEDVPLNQGCFAPITICAPEGTIVHARSPAAVAAGNVETSQRLVDVVLGALSLALPDRLPAASQGTMNNLTLGGLDPATGDPWAYYETMGGGSGGGPAGPGASGIHCHMSNTRNTPVEALEYHYPLRVWRYGLRDGSGGAGRHPGGEGLVREVELLAGATVTLVAERRDYTPYVLAGGVTGAPGQDGVLVPGGQWEPLPAKGSRSLPTGARLRILTPGGGGWGR